MVIIIIFRRTGVGGGGEGSLKEITRQSQFVFKTYVLVSLASYFFV